MTKLVTQDTLDAAVAINAGLGFGIGAYMLANKPFATALGLAVVYGLGMVVSRAVVMPLVRKLLT